MELQRYRKFLPLLFFAFFFFLYFSTQKRLSGIVLNTVNSVFYADTSEIVEIMKRPTFELDAAKHLLFSVTTYPVAALLAKFLGFGQGKAALTTVNFFGAVNVLLSFFVFGLFISDRKTVFLLTFLYGVLFSNLVLSCIPETYVLANLMILAYVVAAKRFTDGPGYMNNFLLSAVTGISALYNPPLLLLLAASGYITFARGLSLRALRLFAMNVLVAVWIYVIVSLIAHPNFFYMCAVIVQYNASSGNFLRSSAILNVMLSFFAYAIASPLGRAGAIIGVSEARDYFTSPLRFVLISSYLCFLLLYVRKIFANIDLVLTGLLFWVLFMVLFYIYFNPREAILYSSQTLLPVLLAAGIAFEKITYRYKYGFAACFAGLLLVNNYLSLAGLVYKP